MATDLGRVDIDYLDDAKRQLQVFKQRAHAKLALKPGMSVLEVGCGPATDTLTLAEAVGPDGRVVGIDHDAEMVRVADERAAEAGLAERVRHLQADATALPFDDGAFDAVRSERMLQHLAEPERAIAEMVRVTRPGGRVEVVDTDWGMSIGDATERELMERVHRFMVDEHVITNPMMGRSLFRLLRLAGLDDVRTEVFPHVVHDLAMTRKLAQLDSVVDRAVTAGAIEAAEATRLLADLEEQADLGAHFAVGIMVLATGVRPR